MITKTDFDAKLSNRNKKITQNKTKHLLVENELEKLNRFDLGYFIGKSHFEEDSAQNYLVFQPIVRYFKVIINSDYVSSWKSKGSSAETVKPATTFDNSLTPTNYYHTSKVRIKFTGSCFLNNLVMSYTHNTHRKILNIYIVYELGASTSNNNDPTLKNCLFSTVTLTKNTDSDKYGYSGYGIGFDRRSSFSFPGGGLVKMY